ncbi:ImmA/IrrE family metallo-endopeptidase [Sediminivirga luteola]|uniref:IrrE N-terminal-like domain-containing protein n=1 Tax=Sediminivirga luteola TaxID=1774748 RepID=A0A8J2TX46_9MICO|nr:ImmA/IrrE family metallo-endopeptidase [Sediminivirga luteola]GGA11125.1 hypothetical protein GCM10011333_12460 [Sediminivirga luteola]
MHHFPGMPPRVTIHWQHLPDDLRGATDGRERIWIDPRLTLVEQRCTLVHELVHLEWGHYGCQPAWSEARVRRETARRLITLPALYEAATWAYSAAEAAAELQVTEDVLHDRLAALDARERWELHETILRVRNHG